MRLIAPLISKYLLLLKTIEGCEAGVAAQLTRAVILIIESTYTLAKKLLTLGRMRKRVLTTNLGELLSKVTEEDYQDLQLVIQKIEGSLKDIKVQELQELGKRICWRKRILRGLIEGEKERVYEEAVGEVMSYVKPIPIMKVKKYKSIEDSLRENEKKLGLFSEAFKSKQLFFNNLNEIEMTLALN